MRDNFKNLLAEANLKILRYQSQKLIQEKIIKMN